MKKGLATILVITIAALGCACSKDSKIDSQAEDKAAVETTTEETNKTEGEETTTKETSEATTEETTEETTETTISSEELYQKYVEEIAIDCVESKELTGENAKLFEEPLPLKCTYYYSDDPFEWTAVYLYPSNEDALKDVASLFHESGTDAVEIDGVTVFEFYTDITDIYTYFVVDGCVVTGHMTMGQPES